METPPSLHSPARLRKWLRVGVFTYLFTGLSPFVFSPLPVASAQDQPPQDQPGAEQPQSPRDQAQGYFEDDEARKGLATLADAARKAPGDRAIGAMLYMAIRDHAWHFAQTLPLRHKGPVRALAFSPDGTRFASGSDYGEVFVSTTEPLDADAAAGKRLQVKFDDGIVGLAFSKDGQRLAVVSKAGWTRVWDLAQNKVVFTTPRPDVVTTAFASAKNMGLVAAGMENGTIQVVDAAAGKVAVEIKQPVKVLALAFSHDGEQIAAALADGTARVWAIPSGEAVGAPLGKGAVVASLDFSTDGRYLATGRADGKLQYWDPTAGVEVLPTMDCGAPVTKVSMSPDGSKIATMLDDESVCFWDSLSGKKLGYNVREDDPFSDIQWSRSGLRLITASVAGRAEAWTMYDGSRCGEPMSHDGPILAAKLSDDSKLLATGGNDGLARIWRIDDGLPMPTVRTHSERARTAFYSLAGNDLVTASDDHTAQHWISGQIQPFGPALKQAGNVNCAVFNNDATLILTGDGSGVAQLWDAKTGKPSGAPYKHKGAVNWVDFHPDGKRFVTASGPGVSVWSVDNRAKPLAVIQDPGSAKSVMKCARFSPDGKWLVTASTDGTARIWDATTYKPAKEVINRHAPLTCVRFSVDGSLLVVCGEDAQAVVYDTATWKQVGAPVIAPGQVFSAFITPDNQYIGICAYLLNAVQFYDIKTGGPFGQGLPIPSQATCIDFLVKDKVIIVACDDGTVRAVDSPFVDQDVPPWICDFAERIAGWKTAGDGNFERVDATYNDLLSYVTPDVKASAADFSRLTAWRMQVGDQRSGMPRFRSTLAANIMQRVLDRSVAELFECYKALPGDAVVNAALSLYLPNRRHGEFLADLVLSEDNTPPLARAFASHTLTNNGRSAQAETVLQKSVDDAPNDLRVIRRAAKVEAAMMNEARSVAFFEQSVRLEPNNEETHRAYGWALYRFHEPEKAEAQFRLAEETVGDRNDDLVAGLCLCADMQHHDAEAKQAFGRLAEINPDWKKAAYIASLRGWTGEELRELERLRAQLYKTK